MKNLIAPKPMLSAVVIRVWNNEGNMDYKIDTWSSEFNAVINGQHPEDNFDNCDVIPKEEGNYEFDVTIDGGEDFNGESTEYWSECLLSNCRAVAE